MSVFIHRSYRRLRKTPFHTRINILDAVSHFKKKNPLSLKDKRKSAYGFWELFYLYWVPNRRDNVSSMQHRETAIRGFH